MNMHPVHYAPHHTGHQPLCGATKEHRGLLIGTMERDEITCFPCIDQYEERSMTPAQIEALADVRDEIDALFAELEERAVFEARKRVTLHALAHMLSRAPWWALRLRFRLHRAMVDIQVTTFEDLTR